MKQSRAKGFTLVELMITVALVVIVMAFAGPAFQEMILNNQRATQINAMLASLNLARAEAVKRGATTVVCVSDGAATPDCDGAPTGWEDGWIVFVDGNRAGASENSLDDPEDANGNGAWDQGEDALLEVHSPLAVSTTLHDNIVANQISFNRLSGTAGTLRHCDSRGAEEAGGIIISLTGRPRAAVDSDANGTVEDGAGNDMACP